jgi:hypothetical protein
MGGLKKVPSEGGSGGRRGHSGMEHRAYTAEIKNAAKTQRRITDRKEARLALADHSPSARPLLAKLKPRGR